MMKKIVVSFLTICVLVLLYSFTSETRLATPKSSTIQMVDDVEVEVNFYEESEFRAILETSIASMNENPENQKIIVQRGEEEGVYGLSDPISAGDEPSGERCGDCGPTVDQVLDKLTNEPCWWLIEFTNLVWGWDGC
jgi:hypothetical protein